MRPPRYQSEDSVEAERILRALRDNSPEAGAARTEVAGIYVFLDVLDRKANSLMTLNSLLFGIVGLLVFRPILDSMLDSGPTVGSPFGAWQIVPALFALIVPLGSIAASLILYRVRWPYLGHVRSDDPASWAIETRCLARECSLRTRRLRHIWIATILAVVAAAVATILVLAAAANVRLIDGRFVSGETGARR